MSAGLCVAFTLDAVYGEPPEKWHPICWMGKAIDWIDVAVIGRGCGRRCQKSAGVFTAFLLPLGTFIGLRALIGKLPFPVDRVVDVALLSSSLACRSLYEGAVEVEEGLEKDIEKGRFSVSKMVGRDTAGLDEEGIARAAVESVAENTNDGVIAPLFYGFIGGAPLALAYKMINTLDSMIGYRNERYRHFGWAAARLDDIAGYVPARLTALAMVSMSPVVGGYPLKGLKIWRNDAGHHPSPNAGVCEAAAAGSLGVRLGGSTSYAGKVVEKPVLGEGLEPPALVDIRRAARLMYAAAASVLIAGSLAGRIIKRKGS